MQSTQYHTTRTTTVNVTRGKAASNKSDVQREQWREQKARQRAQAQLAEEQKANSTFKITVLPGGMCEFDGVLPWGMVQDMIKLYQR
jgi:hypothetical protein